MPTVAPARALPRDERHEHAAQAARRGDQHRRPGVDQAESQAAAMRGWPRVTAGASRRDPPARPDDGQRQPDQRAEDEEEAQVGRRRDAAPADVDDLGRVDGEGGDDRRDEADQAGRRPDGQDPRAGRPRGRRTRR